ncbi:MAG: UDP-N-acetylmuramoyl-L-alanyl-D-glutamate--2,6-diaminopimelate ligase [Ruminococcaceae bacterium]|nr:UDP-N-acetylmuramoyl-L-alanyl-D-glutamate--2,6-diaminopimelate ligase [Oscillospiraceae bacterium]
MKLLQLMGDYQGLQSMVPDVEIKDICYDSRKVTDGSLFVCVTGFVTDGHRYADAAVKNGAAVLICEHEVEADVPQVLVDDSRKALAYLADRYYDHPSGKMKLIGITGTNGKTTTTYLVKQILEHAGYRVGLIGTNQNMIGDTVLPADRTTPESLELQELFFKMAESGVDYVVMEISSHSLELSRVAYCEIDVGAFTNLTRDHLDFHQDMEHYFQAKAKLFHLCKTGVVNIDDDAGIRILEQCSCVPLSYGVDNAADIYAHNMEFGNAGSVFTGNILGKEMKITLNTPGKFSVYNGLCAIGICTVCGISEEVIAKGLCQMQGVSGRAEVMPLGKPYTVMIDYAHTPDGLENIIKSVRGFAKGRVVTLFGCGGDRDRTKRPVMGRIAGELSDFCIVTSDNPRTEDPESIIREIEEGISQTDCEYVVIVSRRNAIGYALKNAKEDDVIILAGKGHETYQILKEGTIHFDEREVVMEWLKELEQ